MTPRYSNTGQGSEFQPITGQPRTASTHQHQLNNHLHRNPKAGGGPQIMLIDLMHSHNKPKSPMTANKLPGTKPVRSLLPAHESALRTVVGWASMHQCNPLLDMSCMMGALFRAWK